MSAAGAMGCTAAVLALASFLIYGGWLVEDSPVCLRVSTVLGVAAVICAIASFWMAVPS